MPTDDEKLQRLIDEGVVDAGLPDAYQDVVRGLTPEELEVISSINKRFKLAGRLGGADATAAIHF